MLAGEPYLVEKRKKIWSERIMGREKRERILLYKFWLRRLELHGSVVNTILVAN